MRKVCYITGTRADFGLMNKTLDEVRRRDTLQLDIIVTGMHLSRKFGYTVNDISNAGFEIYREIPVDLEETDGSSMALAMSRQIEGFVSAFAELGPDCVLLLGDRGEMLAAALAAVFMNIPVVHVCGGERSGTVDEMIRHSISKLSHYHFVSTDDARNRLIRMGEKQEFIKVVGAPGLDGLMDVDLIPREILLEEYGFDALSPLALVVFHPVVQEYDQVAEQMEAVLGATSESGYQILCLYPNSDAGSQKIIDVISDYARESSQCKVVKHLVRTEYLSWLKSADILVGNSSSGIVEAASMGTPVVNVGDRQKNRERNSNTFDCECIKPAILKGIAKAKSFNNPNATNLYGDGTAWLSISNLLEGIDLRSDILKKCNTY